MFVSIFLIFAVYAQEESTDISTIDENAELSVSEGITPDSGFYFVESGILERFRDEIENREKKVAEIRAMIDAGDFESARIALERYREYADNLEREVSPEQRDEARRSAAAIYNVLKSLEVQIPDQHKEDFFDDIVEREGRIVTAVEIAGRIKELCEQLSNLDPLEYSRVCRTDDDSPDWKKRLDKDLTDEQRTEAENFGRIMSQCFETAGQECACEEIPFKDFAETCLIAAPLATACEIENDEEACEAMDNLEMPELPEHLQDVFDSLERDISGSRMDLHMPRECREAGVTSPRECMRIMIQTHAPEECRQALIDANVQNEREAREICERIMFEQNAPVECIEQGLRDFKECGKLMFELNAPKECIDAGLTGEHRSDHKKCEEIMRSLQGGERHGGFGANCAGMENPEERLACYDNAARGFSGGFEPEFREGQPPGGWPQQCRDAGATTRESCEQVMREQFESQQQGSQEFGQFDEFQQPEGFEPPQCGDGESLVCNDGSCTCISQGTETTTTSSDTTTTTGAVINDFYRYYFG